MVTWLESQDVRLIVPMAFLVSYALAALVFIVIASLSRRPAAAVLKATTPVMLTPLGLLGGLVIGFLASHVWSNVDRANGYVSQEASALSEVLLLARALPDDVRGPVRDGIGAYLRFVEEEDWPAMAAGDANLGRRPLGLPDAMAALLAYAPTEPGRRIAQEHAVGALEHALEARRSRIVLSEAAIAPIQWRVIIVLDLLILLTIGAVHIDRPAAAALSLFTFSTAIAACLVLLLANDRPFNAGGFSVQPTALREIRLD